MSVVRHVSSGVGDVSSVSELLQRTIETVVKVLNAESGSIFLLNPSGTLTMRAGCGRHTGLVGTATYNVGEGITGLIATGRILTFDSSDELQKHPSWVGKYDKVLWPSERPKPQNLLGLPIMLNHRVLGVWKVENLLPSEGHPAARFTEHDIQTGQILSSFLAYQIEREDFKGNLISDLRLLAKSSIGIENATSEEDAILAVMLALEESEFGDSILSLYDRETKQIRGHLGSKGVKAAAVSAIRIDISSPDLSAVALTQNRPVFVPASLSSTHGDPEVRTLLGWKAQYIVPLRLDCELLGTLQIHMGDAEAIGEDEELILQAFAGHFAISISRARSIAGSIELTNQVMSGSRFIVAETLSAIAVHSIGHKLDDILTRLNADLKKREIRERRDLLHMLTDWRDTLTAGQADLRSALKLVRESAPSTQTETVDVHLAAQETLDMWIGLIHQSKCTTRPHLLAANSQAVISPHAFREIISVLIVNAVQAHAKNIEIRTRNADELDLPNQNYIDRAVILEFEDDGVGLVTLRPEEIFEPTYTTKPEKFGTGLGLFIARRLARQSGGELSYSKPTSRDRGAAFHLVLPIN